ncbi:MAG: nucleotidyl transferase AbiEii/AbiGii toxin family protein, partial [Micrococcales bacterium]
MFERPRHRAIFAALGALDAEVLGQHECAFGGGTAIAMLHGEFRESVDIDFIVSNTKGYSALRDLVRRGGFQTLLRADQAAISDFTPFTHDQYGIRGRVR